MSDDPASKPRRSYFSRSREKFEQAKAEAKLQAAKELARAAEGIVRGRKPRRSGRVSHAEKIATAAIICDPSVPIDAQVETVALALNRTESAAVQAIEQARKKLNENAEFYVDAHKQAVLQALATNDPDVARKGAEWGMANLSARRADGSQARIVDAAQAASTAPAIAIGINLGGLAAKPDR